MEMIPENLGESNKEKRRSFVVPAGGYRSQTSRFHPAVVHFVDQGNVLEVKVENVERHGGGRRGPVREFTRASRKRMLVKMARLDEPKCEVLFITLTFKECYPGFSGAKKCFWRFRRRFERAYGKMGIVWRIAPQKRGAPHFHLVVFRPADMTCERIMKLWDCTYTRIRAMWGGCIREYLTEAGRELLARDCGFTDVEWITGDLSRVKKYVCSYVAHSDAGGSPLGVGARGQLEALDNVTYVAEERQATGRCWGIWNATLLPWAELREGYAEWGSWFWKVQREAAKLYPKARIEDNIGRQVGFMLLADCEAIGRAILLVSESILEGVDSS